MLQILNVVAKTAVELAIQIHFWEAVQPYYPKDWFDEYTSDSDTFDIKYKSKNICRLKLRCIYISDAWMSHQNPQLQINYPPAPIFLSDLDNRTQSWHSGFIRTWKPGK